MKRQTKRIHLIAAAALITLSALAVAAAGPRRAPVPDAPGSVYVYFCRSSQTSEEKTCRGSTSARPGKLEARAR